MAKVLKRASRVKKLLPVLKDLGWRNLASFAQHKVRLKTGYYRKRNPSLEWIDCREANTQGLINPFREISLDAVRSAQGDAQDIIVQAGHVLKRENHYFSRHWLRIPPTWRENPKTQYRTQAVHWSLIPDFHPEQGDIKWIWEPSRFEWVFVLGRAYAATREDRYAEQFWTLFEDWRASNPPNTGINWKCGQESSFKIFALAFADGAFKDAPATTPERIKLLWQAVVYLADRVDAAIGYALSQRNNHGISEAVALYLAGTCLPSEPGASQWVSRGKKLFEYQVLDQFAEDGGYVQQSLTYQRLAMRDASIYLFVARARGEAISQSILSRLHSTVSFMSAMVEHATGRVPNYGANDGANIFCLCGCDYLDFRPCCQTLSALLDTGRVFADGLWNEELAWLGVSPKGEPTNPKSFSAGESGYYGLRNQNSFLLTRCHSYKCRPGHADMLAADIWIGGTNIVLDAGTYQYYDPQDFGSKLKETSSHSTIEINGHSQMTKGSRFLWLDWTKSKLLKFDADKCQFSGEHYGYKSLDGVVHRRTIYGENGNWLIVDDLLLDEGRSAFATLRWRLNPIGGWEASVQGAKSMAWNSEVRICSLNEIQTQFVHGQLDSPETVTSQYYGELAPVDLVKTTCQLTGNSRLITTIGRMAVERVEDGYRWGSLQVGGNP